MLAFRHDNKGHGAMGLRDRMRDFVDLLDATHAERTVVVEMQPIREVTEWAPDEDGAYVSNIEFIFDGIRRDIVDVKSLIDPSLVRVETVAECRSTEGTYFYDPEVVFDQDLLFWDDGISQWDSGQKWDQFTQLFVHLTGDFNPDETTIVAVHSFNFAPKGMVQPRFGPSKLLNGGFENWTGGEADDWVVVEGSGFNTWDDGITAWDGVDVWDEILAAIFQETTAFRIGTSALCISVLAAQIISLKQTIVNSFTPGKIYRIYGAYRTGGSVTAQIAISSNFTTPGDSIYVDGRTTAVGSTVHIPLRGTGEEWRRFSFDFIAFSSTLEFMIRAVGGSSPGEVCWDDMDVRRIWSYDYYEPRVQPSAIPETRVGSHDIFFGRKNIGVGSVKLINANNYFYELLPELEWMNQNCIVMYGGEFPPQHPDDISQEILLEDFERAFTGLIQGQEVEDETLRTDLQDLRSFFHSTLPINVYDVLEFATMDPNLQGDPRPLFFGEKSNITPARIVANGTTGYGTYELADVTDAPGGIESIDAIYSYLDSTAASGQVVADRILLTLGTDYTQDLAMARFTIINDVKPFKIDNTNNLIDFNDGGGAVELATLSQGLYTANALAAEIQTKMNAVAPGIITVIYDNSTHKFTISTTSVTLTLLIKTGTSAATSVWKTIGFNPSADKTGATSYVSDESVFESADENHILRVNAHGFIDDLQGTFTGVPEQLITIGADILRVILRNYMKKSTNLIDEPSFLDARTNAPEELAMYLNAQTSTKDIFDGLEFSNAASIVVDADGKVFYKVNLATIPAGQLLTADDKEIQRYVGEYNVQDIYQTIRIAYDQDPTTNKHQVVEETDPSVVIRLGRPDSRTFNTFIKRSDDARVRAAAFLELANAAPRKTTVNLLGGKYIRLDVGDKITFTRENALGLGGTIQEEVMRIVSIRKQPQTGRVNLELTDNT